MQYWITQFTCTSIVYRRINIDIFNGVTFENYFKPIVKYKYYIKIDNTSAINQTHASEITGVHAGLRKLVAN